MSSTPRTPAARPLPLAALVLAACGGAPVLWPEPPVGVVALHDLHQPTTPILVPTGDDDFYRLPFPNDLRRRADGTVDLARYPRDVGVVRQYIETFDGGTRGFGTNAAIYFRFTGAIDQTTLPLDAAASLAPAATAFVVDVTPGSPTWGRRSPVLVHYVASAYDFIGPHWVALRPYPGVPLRQETTYAALLTDGILDDSGRPVRRDPDLDAALREGAAVSTDAGIARAARTYAPLAAWLATRPGLAAHVVNAAVFTTLDATGLLGRLRRVVHDRVPPPVLDGLVLRQQSDTHDTFAATYEGPNFQQGDPPYAVAGGAIVEVDGLPRVQRMETLRLSLAIPAGDMPAKGWPVVLYAPGTGGSAETLEKDGSATDADNVVDAGGGTIARLAMVSIDPVLHGPRAPADADPEFTFFNYRNPVGARFNPLQGAADNFQLLRLVKAIDVAAEPSTGRPIRFDPDRIYFKGHSQGSLTGALFLAAEPEVKAAVLSGAGSNLVLSVLNKRSPVDIAGLVAAVFRDPVDPWHPVLNLLQAYLEESDPANYVRAFFLEPPPGSAPKSIFQSLGLGDPKTPPLVIKAEALAAGLQPVLPALEAIEGLDLVGQAWTSAPVAGNVAGGRATGVLLEYEATEGCSSGHGVIFCNPAAVLQSNRFLATHAATGVARLE